MNQSKEVTQQQIISSLLEENRALKEKIKRLTEVNQRQDKKILALEDANKHLTEASQTVQDIFVADCVALCADTVTTKLFNVCRLKELAGQHPVNLDIQPQINFWDLKDQKASSPSARGHQGDAVK
ncbi:unnamed protein product [Sympodiomycopsis kandeliae]